MKTITFLFLFLLTLPSVALAKGKAAGFVEVKNGRFEKSGKPYFFLGANFWQGMNYGASDQKLLKRELNLLQSIGVTQLPIVGCYSVLDVAWELV